MREWTADEEQALEKIAGELLTACGEKRVVAFYGDMGAGKTTFIRYLCQQLGVVDTVQSPTFSIINEYRTMTGDPLYHFDFYRIRKLEEVYDIGYEDYIYSGFWCFIEWPGLMEDLLPADAVVVKISGLTARTIRMEN